MRRLLATTLLLFAGVFVSSSCGNSAGPTPVRTPLSLVRFSSGPGSFTVFSGMDAAQNVVVRGRDAWVRTWSDIHSRVSPAPALPDVDFSREMVVVAAMGTRSSSGFDVVFAGASEADGVVTIDIEARSPGPRCATLTVLTAPVDLARVPRRDGAVEFHSTSSVVNCP